MRNHTLMQTIARTNRVFPGKHSGQIVDYANVFASLEKALSLYGVGQSGQTPVEGKDVLIGELRQAIAEARSFCLSQQVELERIEAIGDAVDALISPDSRRNDFPARQRLVQTLYKALKPDRTAVEFSGIHALLALLAAAIRERLNPDGPPEISGVMEDITQLLDASITAAAIQQRGLPPLDLSQINFQALAEKCKQSKR